MIIYNITTKVHPAVDAAWLQWQRLENIPDMMATGFFISYQLCRLLEQDDSDGNTYALQYTTTAAQHQQYMHLQAAMMQQKAVEKWRDAVISFSSVLQVIQ